MPWPYNPMHNVIIVWRHHALPMRIDFRNKKYFPDWDIILIWSKHQVWEWVYLLLHQCSVLVSINWLIFLIRLITNTQSNIVFSQHATTVHPLLWNIIKFLQCTTNVLLGRPEPGLSREKQDLWVLFTRTISDWSPTSSTHN